MEIGEGRGNTYADMIGLIRRVAHRQLGNHLRVVGDFGSWADAGGSDVTDAATL